MREDERNGKKSGINRANRPATGNWLLSRLARYLSIWPFEMLDCRDSRWERQLDAKKLKESMAHPIALGEELESAPEQRGRSASLEG